MRLTPLLLLLAAGQASAADVLWLSEPSVAIRAQVTAAEGGAELDRLDLLPEGAAWSAKDDALIEGLGQALTSAREYETRLDGELVIMQELAVPIEAVTALRNDDDRAALYAALAYQGFAVDRFFGDDLGGDERAADFRIAVDGRMLPSPWAHAIGMEPERAISPYEIADAPSRVRYEALRTHVTTALPALLAPSFPSGVALVVDGRPEEVGPAGTVKLTPGRHLVHAELDGRILQRWTLDLAPTAREDIALSFDPAAVDAWLAGLPAATPPAFVGKEIARRGGLLVVDPTSERAFRVSSDGTVTEEPLPEVSSPEAPSTSSGGGPSFGVALGAGWLGSPDFYFQDPLTTEASFGTVNAMALGVGIDGAWDVGLLRITAGADLLLPTGANHAAKYGDQYLRVRPTPFLGIGIKPVQAAVGYVLPHHLAVGGRLTLPLTSSGLELRGTALAGLPPRKALEDGSTWEGHAMGTAWLGVGWRLGS